MMDDLFETIDQYVKELYPNHTYVVDDIEWEDDVVNLHIKVTPIEFEITHVDIELAKD